MIVNLFNQALSNTKYCIFKGINIILGSKPILCLESEVCFEKAKDSTGVMCLMQMALAKRVKLCWHCTFPNDHFLSNIAAVAHNILLAMIITKSCNQ